MSTLTIDEFRDRTRKLIRTGAMADVLLRVATSAGIYMQKRAKYRTTGGNPLHVKDGPLRNSITFAVENASARGITAIVSAGGSRVPYAAIHEFGGPIKTKTGKVVGHMPKRPYLAPSRRDAARVAPHDMIREVNAAFRTVNLG